MMLVFMIFKRLFLTFRMPIALSLIMMIMKIKTFLVSKMRLNLLLL